MMYVSSLSYGKSHEGILIAYWKRNEILFKLCRHKPKGGVLANHSFNFIIQYSVFTSKPLPTCLPLDLLIWNLLFVNSTQYIVPTMLRVQLIGYSQFVLVSGGGPIYHAISCVLILCSWASVVSSINVKLTDPPPPTPHIHAPSPPTCSFQKAICITQ